VDGLDAETLLGLLLTYKIAIAELQATHDAAVKGLIARLVRRRAEVVSALASARAVSS